MIVEFYNPDQELGAWAPELNKNSNYPRDAASVTASGYGRLSVKGSLPGHLRSVDVPVVAYETCKIAYPDVVKEGNICAGNEMFDSCKGDSGGPLWERSGKNKSAIRLIGVVSYGYGCAFPNAPGVYTRISGYLEWIKDVIALPDTEYVPQAFPLWKILLAAGVAAGLTILVTIVVVICIVRRNRKASFSERGGDD